MTNFEIRYKLVHIITGTPYLDKYDYQKYQCLTMEQYLSFIDIPDMYIFKEYLYRIRN